MFRLRSLEKGFQIAYKKSLVFKKKNKFLEQNAGQPCLAHHFTRDVFRVQLLQNNK